ncbi:hypothetical protein ACP70R_006398 [Stipagrostis hirtigluma subsp. patula]
MEFPGHGSSPASAAADDGRRFPELPPRHGDAMLAIRDALRAQLQSGRLRQEIIVAELARIERAMALRSASHHGIASALGEQFMLLSRRVATIGSERCVGVHDGEVHDLKKDGVHGVSEIKSEKFAMEELGRECLKTSCSTGHTQGDQENAATDECKVQESSDAILPEKTSPAVIWSCAICKVKASSEGHLQQHFAGQKHRSNVATLLSRNNAIGIKAKATAEKSRNVRQHEEKQHPEWLCRFCQSNSSCKSDLENHIRGKRHKAKIQALLEECRNMATNYASHEAKLDPNIVPRDGENPASSWKCNLCQAKCGHQSDLNNHLRGKRHQLNYLVLQVEAMQYDNTPRQIGNDQKTTSEWGCITCQAKFDSESQFKDHYRSLGHQEKVKALRKEGSNAKSGNLKTAKKLSPYGSNTKGKISEKMEKQRTLYFCMLCNLQCNSKNTLAEHRRGRNHCEKVEKRRSLSFCEVCSLQCNSEKMLAHHCTGKKHLNLAKFRAAA